MKRLPSLLGILGMFVVVACASGGGTEGAEPGFEEDPQGQGGGGSDAGGTDAGGSDAGGSSSEGGSSSGGTNSGGSSAGTSSAGTSSGGTSSGGSSSGGTSSGGTDAGGSGGSGQGGSAAGSGGTDAGGSGGSGQAGSGQGGSSGSAGSSGSGVTCDDKGVEPNDSAALAAPACQPGPCEITGSDKDGSIGYGGTKAALFGTVGPGDTDYFKFHGKDTTFSVTDPTAKINSPNVRLCIFTACATETKDHQCKVGQYEENENGLPGCCVDGAGEVTSDHDCAGSATDDDSADIFIRVTASKNLCVNYSVDFHF